MHFSLEREKLLPDCGVSMKENKSEDNWNWSMYGNLLVISASYLYKLYHDRPWRQAAKLQMTKNIYSLLFMQVNQVNSLAEISLWFECEV